jgi:hypothetical protein
MQHPFILRFLATQQGVAAAAELQPAFAAADAMMYSTSCCTSSALCELLAYD